MAISQALWDKAKLLFEHGKTLSEIHKETGIDRSTISKKSKAENWVKNDEKSTLVNKEVLTIIMQDEINQQKSTLNQHELNYHNRQVLERVNLEREKILFDNDTIDNQSLVRKAQLEISKLVEIDPRAILDNLPNLMAIGKMTETNRKQLFGNTETFKPKEEASEEKQNLRLTFE